MKYISIALLIFITGCVNGMHPQSDSTMDTVFIENTNSVGVCSSTKGQYSNAPYGTIVSIDTSKFILGQSELEWDGDTSGPILFNCGTGTRDSITIYDSSGVHKF